MTHAGPAPMHRLICLTGFMGSGKTTVGRLVAAQLGWHFLDLDTAIEQRAGLRIKEIFDRKGESAFRDIEHECLSRILGWVAEQDTRLVLALGGGTIAQLRNLELIHRYSAPHRLAAVIVWLDCPVEELLKRCVVMGDRPLFRDEAGFRMLFEERLPHYRQAEFRVEGHGEPARIAEQVLALGVFERAGNLTAGSISPAEVA